MAIVEAALHLTSTGVHRGWETHPASLEIPFDLAPRVASTATLVAWIARRPTHGARAEKL